MTRPPFGIETHGPNPISSVTLLVNPFAGSVGEIEPWMVSFLTTTGEEQERINRAAWTIFGVGASAKIAQVLQHILDAAEGGSRD